ncbi:MAG: ABC transporter ATP-binding protein [Candidatus Eisenbacteria bacterium]|jgi:ABC-2 type transport system ATP-binding protein|nr:ABC transporter ATP-binding protein [Candidatus Eisenbacteria bacterium]
MIAVEGITKRFAAVQALAGVTFRVDRHEILGFLGPNGAGKTTTMRIITGFLPADSGTVSVDGFTIPGQSRHVRRGVGYVPENAALYRDMTVRGLLAYFAALRGVPRRRRSAAVDSVVERCVLGTVQGRVVGELSRGFRQRLCLAQALVHAPQVLVLDEPTVGLDPKQIHEVRNLIRELGSDLTILLSSHILPEVSATCDRVVIIHQGKIVAEDTTAGLAARLEGVLTVRLSIRGGADQIRALFASLPYVRVVSLRPGEAGVVRGEVRMGGDPALREELARAVLMSGLGLHELTPEGASLEEVFLELTREEAE